jgi:hypothetical protein
MKSAKKREWIVSADVLLPVIVSVQATSAEDAMAKVEAMDPEELRELWSGDTSSIGVYIDGVSEGEGEGS